MAKYIDTETNQIYSSMNENDFFVKNYVGGNSKLSNLFVIDTETNNIIDKHYNSFTLEIYYKSALDKGQVEIINTLKELTNKGV
tara:strand:- start:225 stop:476 length:252 start_codon:yes stop_codon:yes gene_type:complete